jgi:hypothetical protein
MEAAEIVFQRMAAALPTMAKAIDRRFASLPLRTPVKRW